MTIRSFNNYINESLADDMMTEPSSEAAKMAKKMNLTYVGFARYADKTGAVKYIVKNNKLYPFKGKEAEQANIDNIDVQKDNLVLKAQNTKNSNNKSDVMSVLDKKQKTAAQALTADEQIKNNIINKTRKQIVAYDQKLRSVYQPSLFDADEAQALSDYVQNGFNNINRYLYKGFDAETTPDQANATVAQIQALDNAFENAGAPFDYPVYTGLSTRYDPNKIKPGKNYVFRGYISSSLNPEVATDTQSIQGQQVAVILEIGIQTGQKSIYLDGVTNTPGQYETLLPRGTKINVLAGPMPIDPDLINDTTGMQTMLFKCSIVEE